MCGVLPADISVPVPITRLEEAPHPLLLPGAGRVAAAATAGTPVHFYSGRHSARRGGQRLPTLHTYIHSRQLRTHEAETRPHLLRDPPLTPPPSAHCYPHSSAGELTLHATSDRKCGLITCTIMCQSVSIIILHSHCAAHRLHSCVLRVVPQRPHSHLAKRERTFTRVTHRADRSPKRPHSHLVFPEPARKRTGFAPFGILNGTLVTA